MRGLTEVCIALEIVAALSGVAISARAILSRPPPRDTSPEAIEAALEAAKKQRNGR